MNVGKQEAVERQTRCMRKPTTACQRANSKVLGPAVYKNIAEFNKIDNTMGKMGQTNHEAMRKGRPGRLCEGKLCYDSTSWKVPYIGPERGKLREETR